MYYQIIDVRKGYRFIFMKTNLELAKGQIDRKIENQRKFKSEQYK